MSPDRPRRGLTKCPLSTRAGWIVGGGGTSPSGGTGGSGATRTASCRDRAPPRSTPPRATATSSPELPTLEELAIDHPSGFGLASACSCQQGCTSFMTLTTLPDTPPDHAVVHSSENAPLVGPSTI